MGCTYVHQLGQNRQYEARNISFLQLLVPGTQLVPSLMISDLSPLYSRPSSLTPSPSSLSMPPRRNRPGSSTSASDSQSPPSDAPPSPRFSPTSTHPLSDDGESPKTMKNTRPHLGSYSAGKGGCWYVVCCRQLLALTFFKGRAGSGERYLSFSVVRDSH